MDETVFLSLLLAEAPAESFEEPVRRAREEGAPAEEIDRLRDAARQALQLRTVLTARRRRERELAALYETAGDLSSLRDVEQVLQAIVRRARQLLGTDTAYLTLIDEERGDTYMRVTEGVVDESFRNLRLPLGKGLGGLVAETARPYFTADYLEDPQFDHTDYIDAAVVAERITAIIGVPLMLGDKVIGVLFAANRSERPDFSPDEVNLLSSLAAHAAIAIENARLFQDTQAALAELNRSNEVVRAHSEAVERAAAAHERFTNLVLQGGDMGDVARAVAEVLGGDLWVVDPGGRVVAGSAELSFDLPDLGSERSRSRTTPLPSGSGWMTPVFAGNELLGSLVLRSEADLDAADLRTLERAAQVTALLLLNQRSLAEAEHRMRGELVDDLLSHPDRDADELRRRARLVGVDLEAPHVVV
ncbi:MAG: helix-turn-helix domain-containing protein, partial [Nitriliruptorales bacterium]